MQLNDVLHVFALPAFNQPVIFLSHNTQMQVALYSCVEARAWRWLQFLHSQLVGLIFNDKPGSTLLVVFTHQLPFLFFPALQSTLGSKNDTLINITKTNELVIEPWAQQNSSLLSTEAATIERVTDFKLLGAQVDSKLSWRKHTDYVVSRAAKHLYFLSFEMLRLALWPPAALLHCSIRPMLAYCSSLWHHNVTYKLFTN